MLADKRRDKVKLRDICSTKHTGLHSRVYVLTAICGVRELLVRVQRAFLASFDPDHTTLVRDPFDCGLLRQNGYPRSLQLPLRQVARW
jgi:hypothetical protein